MSTVEEISIAHITGNVSEKDVSGGEIKKGNEK